MKNIKNIIGISVLFLIPLLNFGQKVINKGFIEMEITAVDSDDDQVKQMAEMIKGTKTSFYFNAEKSLVQADMMGGMVKLTTLLDNESEDQVLLFDAMGQKIMVESTKADRDRNVSEQAQALKELEVTFDESDTKDILGYKCTKAIIKHPSMDSGISFHAYVAKDIKANNKLIQGMNYIDLGGFPLEYEMNAGPMKMTISATQFKDDFDADVFNLKTGGYKKMTYKEFLDSMGQMGGFGF